MTRTVFVSGCFDLLHSGHVAFLRAAAAQGDELYVALGSDRTVFELKGRTPVNSEQERLYMMQSVSCVHRAFVSRGSGLLDFREELAEMRPDVFVVNEDGNTPAKRKLCEQLQVALVEQRGTPESDVDAAIDCPEPFVFAAVENGAGGLDAGRGWWLAANRGGRPGESTTLADGAGDAADGGDDGETSASGWSGDADGQPGDDPNADELADRFVEYQTADGRTGYALRGFNLLRHRNYDQRVNAYVQIGVDEYERRLGKIQDVWCADVVKG